MQLSLCFLCLCRLFCHKGQKFAVHCGILPCIVRNPGKDLLRRTIAEQGVIQRAKRLAVRTDICRSTAGLVRRYILLQLCQSSLILFHGIRIFNIQRQFQPVDMPDRQIIFHHSFPLTKHCT